jgi:hypothetical protein
VRAGCGYGAGRQDVPGVGVVFLHCEGRREQPGRRVLLGQEKSWANDALLHYAGFGVRLRQGHVEANQVGAAASSGESVPLSESTYVFSTAINPTAEFYFSNDGKVITKVLVRDASGATVSSASVSEQGATLRER